MLQQPRWCANPLRACDLTGTLLLNPTVFWKPNVFLISQRMLSGWSWEQKTGKTELHWEESFSEPQENECIHKHVCMCTHTSSHTYMHTYMHINTHMHINAHAHIHIYKHMHIHINLQTHTCPIYIFSIVLLPLSSWWQVKTTSLISLKVHI